MYDVRGYLWGCVDVVQQSSQFVDGILLPFVMASALEKVVVGFQLIAFDAARVVVCVLSLMDFIMCRECSCG